MADDSQPRLFVPEHFRGLHLFPCTSSVVPKSRAASCEGSANFCQWETRASDSLFLPRSRNPKQAPQSPRPIQAIEGVEAWQDQRLLEIAPRRLQFEKIEAGVKIAWNPNAGPLESTSPLTLASRRTHRHSPKLCGPLLAFDSGQRLNQEVCTLVRFSLLQANRSRHGQAPRRKSKDSAWLFWPRIRLARRLRCPTARRPL